jgi:hypothetical protein
VTATDSEFRSDLAKTPLAEVLETVRRYRVPGVITVVRQGMEKRIFIWHGDVIFATSSDRFESLGHYLLKCGLMSQEQFVESSRRLVAATGTKRLGDILVEMGLLDEARLRSIVLEQVRAIVSELFEWDEGQVVFKVGEYRTDEPIKLTLPTRELIFQGVKGIRDVRRLVSVLGPSWTVFSPAYAAAEIGDVGLTPVEAAYLGLVDGVKTLRELVSAGSGEAAHNAKLIYGFFVLKLIVRRETDSGRIKKLQWKSPGSGYRPGE